MNYNWNLMKSSILKSILEMNIIPLDYEFIYKVNIICKMKFLIIIILLQKMKRTLTIELSK